MSEEIEFDPAAVERLKRLGGVRLAKEMLELFIEHAGKQVAAAVAAGPEGNVGAIFHAAHSLKSSAGNVGARAVQRLAEQLEQAASGTDAGPARALLDPLANAFNRAAATIRDEIGRLSE